MNLRTRLKKAVVSMLTADAAVAAAKTDSSRRFAQHRSEVAKAAFMKAQTKLKRAQRMKQYREAGLI